MVSFMNSMAEEWFNWQFAMLWQTAVLIGIIWIVDVCIRKWAHPQVRYALWMLVLVKLLIPPTWTSPASVTSYIPGLANRAATVMERENSEIPVSDNGARASSPRLDHRRQDAYVPLEIATTSTEIQSGPEGRNTIAGGETPGIVSPSQSSPNGATQTRVFLSWKTYAMLTWLAGMVALGAWLIVRLSGLRREHQIALPLLRVKSSPPAKGEYRAAGRGLKLGGGLPERFYAQLEEVAAKLQLKRLPRVVLTDKVACPAVFGIFHPVLLMPAKKFKNMSRQDTEHILLHELAHIKRGDLFVHAVYMVLQIVYWFNPLLWMARRPMQNLRELCCDATVARILRDKTYRYRETLLETARQLLAEPVDPGLGLLGLFENNNWLVTRLKWLEKNTWKNRPLRIATIIALVAVMTACVLPMANRPDFAVTGSVTDAETGEPIAGAEVFDDGYNDNKLKTATDENGKFVLKTFNEEHNISAKIDGYEKQTKVLKTLPFANHKNFNFALTPSPKNMSEAILLLEHFYSKTVLSLKTGQLIPQQQADASNEPYLFYGCLAPKAGEDYMTHNSPDEYYGVKANNMDIGGGGWSPESKALQTLWSINSIEQLPKMQWQGATFFDNEEARSLFIALHLDAQWPFITAYKGDDGTCGIFEITNVKDRKIHVRFKTLNPPEEDSAYSELHTKNYKAALPNGVTVELLGCGDKIDGERFWQPNGKIIPAESFKSILHQSSAFNNSRYNKDDFPCKAIFFTYSGGIDPEAVAYQFDGMTNFIMHQADCSHPPAYVVRNFPKEQDSFTFNLGIAEGPFQGDWTGSGSTPYGEYIVGNVFVYTGGNAVVNNKTAVTLSHNLQNVQHHLMVKDTGGNWHKGKHAIKKKTDGLNQNTYVFEKVEKNDVDSVILQVRPIQWVTFKNVALRLGRKTEVTDSISVLSKEELTRDNFFTAAREGNLTKVKQFIAQGFDVNTTSTGGPSALHEAGPWGQTEIAQLLIENGADIHLQDRHHRTPLSYAASYSHQAEPTAKLLIENGAEVNLPDDKGMTPLHYACTASMCQMLLEQGADIHARDDRGWTPLHYDSNWGRLSAVQYLIENGANIDALDKEGRTPLMLASTNACSHITEYLIHQHAGLSVTDSLGRTPLHWAVLKNKKQIRERLNGERAGDGKSQAAVDKHYLKIVDTVKLLTAAGADLKAEDAQGLTALDYARAANNPAAVKLLSAEEASPNSELHTKNYTATLPNGVTVELLGICKDPTKAGQQWWKPNGSLMDDLYFELRRRESYDKPYFGYMLQFTPSENLTFRTATGADAFISTSAINKEGRAIAWLGYMDVHNDIPEIPETARITVKVAGGNWQTREPGQYEVFHDAVNFGDERILLSGLRSDPDDSNMTLIEATTSGDDIDIQLVCVNKNGKSYDIIHAGMIRAGGKMIQHSFSVPIQIDEIQKISIKYRKFQTVTFKNVSLRPGRKTEGDWGEMVDGVSVRLHSPEVREWGGDRWAFFFKTDLKSETERVLPHYGAPIGEFFVEYDGHWYETKEREIFETVQSVGPSMGWGRTSLGGRIQTRHWKSMSTEQPMPVFTLGKHTVRIGFPLSGRSDTTGQRPFAASNPVEIEITESVSLHPGGKTEEEIENLQNSHYQTRHFVRLVVGEDEMTFQGQQVEIGQLDDILKQVPNREYTVLQVAFTEFPEKAQDHWWYDHPAWQKADRLVSEYGFDYLSFVGKHPLGAPGRSSRNYLFKPMQFDETISVNLPSAEQPPLAKLNTVTFSKDKAFIAATITSYPKTHWDIEFAFFDANNDRLDYVFKNYENSGIIKGVPFLGSETIEVDMSRFKGLDKAKTFELSIKQSERREPGNKEQQSQGTTLQTNNYTATLPNGVTVELLGLCKNTKNDTGWWSPDGTGMSKPLFDTSGLRTPRIAAFETMYAFLAKATEGENISMQMKIYEGLGSSTRIAKDGTALCYVQHPDPEKTYHKDAFEKGPIEIGVAQGQWIKARGAHRDDLSTLRSYLIGNNDQIVIQPPKPEKGSPDLWTTFGATASSHDYEYKLVFKLKDGSTCEQSKALFKNVFTIETGGLKNSALKIKEFNVDKPIGQIVDYELFYRKFEYITFKNIALRPGGKTEGENIVDKQKVYLPDLESKGVNTVLDLASGQMLSAEGMEKDRHYFEKLGKGDLVYEYARNKSGLLCLRGAKMQLRGPSGLQPTTPEVQRAAFDVYFLKQVPCQYQVTTAEGHKYEIKVLSIKKGDDGGAEVEFWKSESPDGKTEGEGAISSSQQAEKTWTIENGSHTQSQPGKPLITIEASVVETNLPPTAISDFINNELNIDAPLSPEGLLCPVNLTDAQCDALREMMAATADTSLLTCPRVRVFDGENSKIGMTDTLSFTSGYEDDTPKVEDLKTGVQFEFTPQLSKKDVMRLQMAFEKTSLIDVSKETTAGGREIELPVSETKSVNTMVTVPQGKTILVPLGGMMKSADPTSKPKQIILLIKTELETQPLAPGGKTQVESQSSGKKIEIPLTEQSIQNVSFKKDMQRLDALQILSKMYKVNIIPSDSVHGYNPASELYDVTFEDALKAVCGTTHIYEIKDKFVYVYTKEEYEALRSGGETEVKNP